MQRRAAERKLRGLVPFGVARFPLGVARFPVECHAGLGLPALPQLVVRREGVWVRCAEESGTILNGTVSCSFECKEKQK